MRILVYTFRTFPFLEELKSIFPDVFILGKLKEDLQEFYNLILDKNPDIVLGVALSNSSNSYFESKTVNRFNKNAKVVADGKQKYLLFVPNIKKSHFKISQKSSTSFCNYTMYKIKYFLEQKEKDIPFAFVHINKEHIKELPSVLNI